MAGIAHVDRGSRCTVRGRVRALVAVALWAWAGAGCVTRDLGECDLAAAEELVFSPNGMVATKGQALTHDSCGNGAFCHSNAATDDLRYGAPAGMNFDMLPSPTGIAELLDSAEAAWHVVSEGEMPPGDIGEEVTGDGQWSVDVTGLATEAPQLPSLKSHSGKAAFRNWLACGAPTVTDTNTPSWAHAPTGEMDGGTGFDAIYDGILAPRCATAGCHDASSKAGGLAMIDACNAHAALLRSGTCAMPYVVPGDPDASLLVDKLEAETPRCGMPMPPTGPLPADMVEEIRAWIETGAEGATCP